jgi:hypothetical protein
VTFSRKLINVTFSGKPGPTGTPVFSSSAGIGSNVTLSGLRTSAKITKAGGVQLSALDLRIYGMTLSLMNQVTTFRLGAPGISSSLKAVTVAAGDADGGSTVFIGNIQDAYADFTNAPDVAFYVSAFGGLVESATTVPSSAFRGSVDVAQILKRLADNVGLGFENSGVDVKLNNPYHTGSTRDQARQIAKAAGINMIIDDGVMAIWPFGAARDRPVVEVSPSTGLRGYPAYDPGGVVVQTEFNPNIHHGATINIKNASDENGGSVLPAAEGEFVVMRLDHDLESMTPHGQWTTTILAQRKGQGLA